MLYPNQTQATAPYWSPTMLQQNNAPFSGFRGTAPGYPIQQSSFDTFNAAINGATGTAAPNFALPQSMFDKFSQTINPVAPTPAAPNFALPQSMFDKFSQTINPTAPVATPSMQLPQANQTPVNVTPIGATPTAASAPVMNYSLPPLNQSNLFNNAPQMSYIGQGDTTGTVPVDTTTPGFFSDMGGADWLNFGSGLLTAGLGAAYQNRQLNLAEDELNLTKAKWEDYKAERKKMDDISAQRAR